MPKRPNPFGDASPMQFKSHIGKKEIDLGVNMDQNMQAVYEKTKNMLFEGSRKANPSHLASDIYDTNSNIKPLPGQLRLDHSGHLYSETSMDTESVPQPAMVPAPPAGQVCYSCNWPCQHGLYTCSFCERHTCVGCTRQCSNCQGLFCQLCSTVNYDDCCERATCLQCCT